MTTEQLSKLKEIAGQVKANYQHMEVADILNRIHLITNRDYKRCVEGFKKMIANELFPSDFVINAQRLPKIEKLISEGFVNKIFEQLDLEIVSIDELNEGPKDDSDEESMTVNEPVDPTSRLFSHLDSNF